MKIRILEKWDYLLDTFSLEQTDLYFEEKYVKLYESAQEHAVCFVCEEDKNVFLFPFLLRICDEVDNDLFYDFETAYGYGGPISNTNDVCFIRRSLIEFYSFAKAHNYVAGFIRFHPLLKNEKEFNTIGKVIKDRHTIAMDMQCSEDSIWINEIHTKNRNTIKKAAKNGLQFVADYKYAYLKDFINLYNSTMDKLSADSFYYFNDSYYDRLSQQIPNSFLGVVLKDEKVIAAAIFFYNGIYGHYHLSGSLKTELGLYPNNFMLWESAKELKKHGVTLFHLGGGTNSDENNSLLLFKQKFSKSFCDFCIGKVVFNEEKYLSLCSKWEKSNIDRKGILDNVLLKYKY